jgi:hypothetical protein
MRTVTLLLFLLTTSASAQITNIRTFLDKCPQNDPAFAQIRADFKIRRAGVLVDSVPPCTEPVSMMPTAAYNDELVLWQTLRVIYAMDRGKSGHLPWTNGTLYDWMKSKIGGIDIVQGSAFCCELFDFVAPPPPPPGSPPPGLPPAPYWYIAVPTQDDFNREFDKNWRGIARDIDLIAHEVRHRDGYAHTSCCSAGPGACDQTYDPANLSPYAIQWWLNSLWLDGTINVGMECLPPLELTASNNWFLSSVNQSSASRFCDAKPALLPLPTLPGGRCLDTARRRAVARR